MSQAKLFRHLEEENVKVLNRVGVDINLVVDHDHMHNQIQFLSGFGPRKATKYLMSLKSHGKPIFNRDEIFKSGLLTKKVFWSSLGFTKVRVPPEKRPEENFHYNILDQTRVHLRNYAFVQMIAKLIGDGGDALDNEIQTYTLVENLVIDSNKLKEAKMSNSQLIEKAQTQQVFNSVIDDLIHPFKDFREDKVYARTIDDQKFSNQELFYYLIDETDRTFKRGMIVSATVVKVVKSNGHNPQKIVCRLENGLDAVIM